MCPVCKCACTHRYRHRFAFQDPRSEGLRQDSLGLEVLGEGAEPGSHGWNPSGSPSFPLIAGPEGLQEAQDLSQL